MTDSLDFGTNSIKHSSMNTIVFNFFAVIMIDSNSFFDNNSPVGLLGLQRKIHPFFGIFKMNELIYSFYRPNIIAINFKVNPTSWFT